MAGDRRATAGYTIANRRIEKVLPPTSCQGSRSPAPRGRRSRWCGCSRCSCSTTRRSRASSSHSRQGQPARADGAGQPPRRPCRASSSSRSSPATTTADRSAAVQLRRRGREYEEAVARQTASGVCRPRASKLNTRPTCRGCRSRRRAGRRRSPACRGRLARTICASWLALPSSESCSPRPSRSAAAAPEQPHHLDRRPRGAGDRDP